MQSGAPGTGKWQRTPFAGTFPALRKGPARAFATLLHLAARLCLHNSGSPWGGSANLRLLEQAKPSNLHAYGYSPGGLRAWIVKLEERGETFSEEESFSDQTKHFGFALGIFLLFLSSLFR